MDIQYNFKDILLLIFAIRKDEEIPKWALEYEWPTHTLHIDLPFDDIGSIFEVIKGLLPEKK